MTKLDETREMFVRMLAQEQGKPVDGEAANACEDILNAFIEFYKNGRPVEGEAANTCEGFGYCINLRIIGYNTVYMIGFLHYK